jgi:hypothetical protein
VQALRLLPVSDSTIYRFRRDKVLSFHLMTVFDFLTGLGALAFALTLPWLAWITLPFIAASACLFSVALAMLIGARLPRLWSNRIGLGVALIFGAWFLGHKYIGPQLIAALDFSAPAINLFVPSGWPLEFFHWIARDKWWPPLLTVIPLGYVFWSFRQNEQVVSGRFPYQEPSAAKVAYEQIPAGMAGGAQPSANQTIGITAITEGILSRACFVLPSWDEDWPQRLLWRWLTPREQVVANFVFAKPPTFLRPWFRIFLHFLAAVIVWEAFRILLPSTGGLMLVVTLLIPTLEMLAQSWPAGAAFRRVRNSGLHVALIAPYPIRFHEVTGLLLKCSVFQWPAAVVVVTSLFVVVLVSNGISSVLPAALIGFRASLMFVALRLALLVLNFASVSNDTSRSAGRTWLALLIFVIEIGIFAGLAIGAFVGPNEAFAWTCCVILMATQYAFLRFYGWLWNRGAIDLVNLDPR